MNSPLFERPHVPRRLVTGEREGRSVLVSDGPVPNALHHTLTPGMMSSVVHRTATPPNLAAVTEETAPKGGPLLPGPGETTLLIVRFPPDSVYLTPGFDGKAADQELREFAPDFAACFEADSPGKHTTTSVDYDIVLEGRIWLELDDETVQLDAGDVVVQNGTRHAWRNKGDRPATMVFVLLGAARR